MKTEAELIFQSEAVARKKYDEYIKLVSRVRINDPIEHKDDQFVALETLTRNYENSVAAASLLGCVDGLRALAESAVKVGAISEYTAQEVMPGIYVYGLLDSNGSTVGFVAREGEDSYATTFTLGEPGQEGVQTSVLVVRLNVPGNNDAKIIKDLMEGQSSYDTHTTKVSISDHGPYTTLTIYDRMLSLESHTEMEWWPRYAEMIRPFAIAQLLRVHSSILMGSILTGSVPLAFDMVKDDGGFRGIACETYTKVSGILVAEEAFRWAAPRVDRTAKALLAKGYEWPNRALEYGDHDRFTFVVRSPDERTIGVWYRNIDQFAGRNEHMSVLVLDEQGEPTSIAIYPTWRAWDADDVDDVNDADDDDDNDDDDDDVNDADPRLMPSEDSEPMRPTRGMLARRIAAGEPLPSPACGMNLLLGVLLPEQDFYKDNILDGTLYGIQTNINAAVCLEKGEVPGYAENSVQFDEPGEVGHVSLAYMVPK